MCALIDEFGVGRRQVTGYGDILRLHYRGYAPDVGRAKVNFPACVDLPQYRGVSTVRVDVSTRRRALLEELANSKQSGDVR